MLNKYKFEEKVLRDFKGFVFGWLSKEIQGSGGGQVDMKQELKGRELLFRRRKVGRVGFGRFIWLEYGVCI